MDDIIDKNKTFLDFFISGNNKAANIAYKPMLKLDYNEAGSICPTRYPATLPNTHEI